MSDADQRAQTMKICLPPFAIAVLAMFLAGLAYGRFLDNPRQLWTFAPHDRNAHYLLGLSVALDLRGGDLVQLLHDLDGARVWGPLHGIVVGLILAVAGPDYRLAVLPSLLAWVGSAVLSFLIARRAVPRGGNLAGAVAALFILASPAFHAFAMDIMLESSGACLTLLALYLYVVTRQSTSVGAARGLGAALSALFVLKYNYWLLAVLPLTLAEVVARGRPGMKAVVDWLSGLPWRQWLRAQLRHPLNYLLLILLCLWVAVLLSHKETVRIAGQTIQLRYTDNLVHLIYVVLFLRAAPWWWRHGRQWTGRLPYPFPQLLAWHALPVALWFLLPKRPSYFFWYLTKNHGGEVEQHNMLAAASFYWHCLVTDYHIGLASLLMALCLVAVALIAWRKLRPGGAVVLFFMLLAAFLAVRYPSHRSRFLHSWLATSWVVAGIGLSQLIYGPLTVALGRLRPWLGTAAVLGLTIALLPGMIHAGHAPEGGPNASLPCTLDIADDYLVDLEPAHRPVVLSNAPIKQFTSWTYLQRYGRRAPIESDLPKPAPTASFGEAFEQWLRKTPADAIVYIDAAPGSPLYEEPERPGFEQIPALLGSQAGFREIRREQLPGLGCKVTTWKRDELSARRTSP